MPLLDHSMYALGYAPTLHFRRVMLGSNGEKLQQLWRTDHVGWGEKWIDIPVYYPTADELKEPWKI